MPAETSCPALARAIDHTLLVFSPDEDPVSLIHRLCDEAMAEGFYAVCVRPGDVRLCKARLWGSAVKIATVIAFPQAKTTRADQARELTIGQAPLEETLAELAQALADGADELDIVLDVAQFKRDARQGDFSASRQRLAAWRNAAGQTPIKLILETDLLAADEIAQAVRLAVHCGVSMVKTSTGMIADGAGAVLETVQAMKIALGQAYPRVGIKASGGIRTLAQAEGFLQSGVARLGTSAGMAILHEARNHPTSGEHR